MNQLDIATKQFQGRLFVYVKQKINHLDSDRKTHYELNNRPSIEDVCLEPLRFALDKLSHNVPTVVFADFHVNGLDLSEFSEFTNIQFGYKDSYTNPASRQVELFAQANKLY